jgi:hypothetical protein
MSLDVQIRDAIELASASGGRLTVAVVENRPGQSEETGIHAVEPAAGTGELTSSPLDPYVRRARTRDVDLRIVAATAGSPEELGQQLESLAPDLWVVTVHASPTQTQPPTPAEEFGKWICESSRHPVWIAGRQTVAGGSPVVMALECPRADSSPALGLSVELAQMLSGRLLVLAVLESESAGAGSAEIVDGQRAAAEQELRRRLRATDHRTIPGGVRIEIEDGRWLTAIRRAAERHPPAVVVLEQSRYSELNAAIPSDRDEPTTLVNCAYLLVRGSEPLDAVTSSSAT